MRRMGAENERGLEEPFVHDPTAAAVAVEVEQVAMRALGVLVAQAEPQELGGIETHVRLDGPLIPWVRRILRRVIACAERPPPPWLHLAPAVPAEAVARLFLERIENAVAVDVNASLRAPDRVDSFTRQRQQRVQPDVGPALELDVVAGQRAS